MFVLSLGKVQNESNVSVGISHTVSVVKKFLTNRSVLNFFKFKVDEEKPNSRPNYFGKKS